MKGNENLIGLDAIFDCSQEVLCLLNGKGQFLKVNKFFSNTLGYNQQELLLRYFLEFLDPEDRVNAAKQFEILFRHKSIGLFKTRFRCANGSYKSFSWNISQLPDLTFYASATEITHYLNIQSQLSKAITDNQKLYDNSLDVLCVFDAEGHFTRVSKASKTIWGYDEHELLGEKYIGFVHPDDVALTITTDLEIKSGKNEINFKNRYIHKNGSVVPVFWSSHYLPLEQITFAIARDASEIEKQKEQIYLNQRRLEALVKSGNDCISILSIDGIYKYVSPSVETLFHLDPGAIIGRSPFDFIHPDDHARIKNILEHISTTEEPVQSPPFKFRNGKGEWCWLETVITNKLNDPAINGIVANSRDISVKIKDEEEKQLAAEKLRLSNERHQLASEATKDIIWDWNLETNQLSWSRGLETDFGYPNDPETLNVNFWKTYIHPEDRDYVLKSIYSVINSPEEKFWREEYRFLKADGSVAYIVDQGYVIRNRGKKAVRMVGAMHNNTELKEKELRILCQNKRLREIAQINSHVIRKPVASILGLISLLDKESVVGEDNLEILEHLLSSTQELDGVIRQINEKTID
jgi:PAS domain S-box-containing protein